MAKIKAFVGYRPPKDLVDKVASPPYDVINSEEARQMAEGNEISFLRINKPEIDLAPDIYLHHDVVYETAVKNLKDFIDRGILAPDPKPCLYAYSQTMGNHTQVGLMTVAAVDDYDEGKIKKHEKTRQDKEDDRARHVDETDCNAGPVFLAFKADADVDVLMAIATDREPEVDFTADDGIGHKLWVIDDDALIDKFIEAFEKIDCTYVADGHHRTKSGSRVRALRREANPLHTGEEEYNWFLTVLFPHTQLKILDYNRVVADLEGLNVEDFLLLVDEFFEVSDTDEAKPTKVHDFGMYLEGRWYRLSAREGTFDDKDPVGCLDVSILQRNLLSPILNLHDPRTDTRIDFVGGIRGMSELEKRVNSGDWQVAFAMYPTSMEQLMNIADAGEIMPPKSTWFEPKLRSGMVVHLLS